MSELVDRARRHLFVLAHPDDDLGYGGLLSRLAGAADVVYLTNGDGPAPELGLDLAACAHTREAEAQTGRESRQAPGSRRRVEPERQRQERCRTQPRQQIDRPG